MHILERIVTVKKREIALKKKLLPPDHLKRIPLFDRKCISMAEALRATNPGIIAEHKRRSPSEAVINQGLALDKIVEGYDRAGANGLSILTDTTFFGGSLEDLLIARSCTKLPILRKDFIIDPYQVLEAKAYGADVILLIAAILKKEEVEALMQLAHDLNMEVLLEVHSKEEYERSMTDGIDMLGVNNRDLKTFQVQVQTSIEMAAHIENKVVLVSESGLRDAKTIRRLHGHGFHGFLIGTYMMKQKDPGVAARELIKQIGHEN